MLYDMTKGSPLKAILMMSIPVMLGNLFQQLYGMVDAIIVGRYLGQNALAAVGSTSSMYSLILWFVIGTTGGFATLVSQDFGAGNYEKMRQKICLSIRLSVVITLITTIFSVAFIKKILLLMNTPQEILDAAVRYIVVILCGLMATMVYNLAAAVLRAMGDARTPLFFLAFSSVLNVVLDIVFIRILHMNTEGAAYATVISQAISGIFCAVYMYKKFPILHFKEDDWVYRKNDARKLLKIGFPLGMNGVVTASGIIIFQVAVNGYGAEVVAAFAAASKVETLTTQILNAYCITMINFVAQNYGAGKFENIKKGVQQCFFLMMGTVLVGMIFLIGFGGSVVSLFIDNPTEHVISYAREYLTKSGIFLSALGVILVFRSAAQGMGDSRIPIINGVVESIGRTLWTIYLCNFGNFHQLCLANPTTWVVAGIVTFILYTRKLKQVQNEFYKLNSYE